MKENLSGRILMSTACVYNSKFKARWVICGGAFDGINGALKYLPNSNFTIIARRRDLSDDFDALVYIIKSAWFFLTPYIIRRIYTTYSVHVLRLIKQNVYSITDISVFKWNDMKGQREVCWQQPKQNKTPYPNNCLKWVRPSCLLCLWQYADTGHCSKMWSLNIKPL